MDTECPSPHNGESGAPDLPVYAIRCLSCDSVFDALRADWCDCIVKQRTVVCPHCSKCFCNAPAAFKVQFWGTAPQAMWDRKNSDRQVTHTDAEAAAELSHPLVLLADDDADVRATAKRVFAELGTSLLLAEDGEHAMELVRKHRPELVLADALMPRVDGRELCLRIKTDPDLGTTYVVVMSSVYNAKKFRFETIAEFKADEYLAKPITLERMQELLKTHLKAPELAT